MNKEAIAELLGRTIESVSESIEFYLNNEDDSDEPDEAMEQREKLEFLLDELVNAHTVLNKEPKPEVMKSFDPQFKATPFIVRTLKAPRREYEDVAMFAKESDAIKFANQIEGGR